MSDLFDTLTDDPPKKKKQDLFDEVSSSAPAQDLFDQVAPEAAPAQPQTPTQQQDLFDELAPAPIRTKSDLIKDTVKKGLLGPLAPLADLGMSYIANQKPEVLSPEDVQKKRLRNQLGEELSKSAVDPLTKLALKTDAGKQLLGGAASNITGAAEFAAPAALSGMSQFNATLARTPNLIYNIAALPVNQALKMAGMPEIKDPAYFEKQAQWWDDLSKETDVQSKEWDEKGEDINTLVKKGDFKEASKWLAYQTIKNMPQQILFLGSAMAGIPGMGLGLAGTTSGAQELAEGRKMGASPTASVANAILNGTIEAGMENLGTFGLFKDAAQTLGKSTTGVIKDTLMTMFKVPLGEANEEWWTSIAQDFSRKITGVDPNAMKGAVARANANAAVGFTSGATSTVPAALATGLSQRETAPRGTISQTEKVEIPSTKIEPKTIGDQAAKYLDQKFPQLADEIANKKIPITKEQLHEVLWDSAAAGEEVLLRGGTPEDANLAAMKAFQEKSAPHIQATEELKTKAQEQEFAVQKQEVEKSYRNREEIPAEVLQQHPDVVQKVNLERAQEAAKKVLSANKIDDRVFMDIVDAIKVDPVAFKKEYGQDKNPDNYDFIAETRTAHDRTQAFINFVKGADEFHGRREAFYATMNMLMNEGERSVLLKKYNGIIADAADAFGHYRAGVETNDSVIDRTFQKIKQFIEKISNYLDTNQFTTADDLIRAIDEGKYADRAAQGTEQTQYSAEPNQDVKFIGYMSAGPGIEPMALYNTHSKDGGKDTVSAESLKGNGLGIPQTPTYDDWVKAGKPKGEDQPTYSGFSQKQTNEPSHLSDLPSVVTREEWKKYLEKKKQSTQYSAQPKNPLETKAIEKFGTTEDLGNAGFVLPSGDMIDFAETKKNPSNPRRVHEHRDIADLYGQRSYDTDTERMRDFMDNTKAVRISTHDDTSGKNISIEAQGPLSQDQLKRIGEYFDTHKVSNSTLEIMTPWGKPVRNRSFMNPTGEDVARFFNGTTQYSAEIKDSNESKKPPKDVYEANRDLQSQRPGYFESVGDNIKSVATQVVKSADKFMGAISTRLKNIDPSLKRALRNFEYKNTQATMKDLKTAETFLKKVQTMKPEDRADFDLARKNGDARKLQEMIIKYKMGSEYFGIRQVLNKVHERARSVGFKIGYKEHYHPRIIKDAEGFLAHFSERDDWSIIDEAIKSKEQALQRYLTVQEKAELINTMLRGYSRGKLALSQTGNMKDRSIEFVDPAMNKFYFDSDAALVRYLNHVNEAIEARRFFGKGNKELGFNNINDSIDAYVMDLLAKKKISKQEKELREILQARFARTPVGPITGLYKNVSYIDTMGSPFSAITQLGDLGVAMYRSNPINALANFSKSLVNKSDITTKDLGVEKIAAEFADPSKAMKAVDRIFKMVGLEKMDRLGKETYVNSVIDNFRKEAKRSTPSKDFMDRLESVFGSETKDVIDDLKNNRTSENVKLLAFNELLDLQPIALSEMPEKYLTGGNGRILYMLKTFTLKQMDLFRNEAFAKMAQPGKANKVEGLRRLIYLAACVAMGNAGSDVLKNLLGNRPTYLPDLVVDNLARLFGVSKYTVYSARNEGLGTAAVKTILPPFKLIDNLYKDFVKINPDKQGWDQVEGNFWKGEKLESTQSIPLFGKLYFWWLGKGVEYSEKTRKKMRKKRQDYYG